MDLISIREQTPGCRYINHLNNAGASLVPASVTKAIQDYLRLEEHYGGYETAAAETPGLDEFYDYAATLLHTTATNIAFTTNATDSYNRALSAIPLKPGDTILLTGNDYPSNYIAFLSLQQRLGINIVTVDNTPDGEMDLTHLDKMLRLHSPRLVSITHIPTSSGLIQPIVEAGAIIARYDTLYLLDACQSLGQLDLDVHAAKADFVSGTMRKFLRGPRGAGLLYVSEKALQMGLSPLFTDIRGADWTAPGEYQLRGDAKRFEDWETAYALQMGSKEAIRYALSLGIDAIAARTKALAQRMRTGLRSCPRVHLTDRGRQLASIITFTIDGATDPESIKQEYRKKGINVYAITRSSAVFDFAEKGIEWVVRASPHYYNSEDEIDQFIEATRQLT